MAEAGEAEEEVSTGASNDDDDGDAQPVVTECKNRRRKPSIVWRPPKAPVNEHLYEPCPHIFFKNQQQIVKRLGISREEHFNLLAQPNPTPWIKGPNGEVLVPYRRKPITKRTLHLSLPRRGLVMARLEDNQMLTEQMMERLKRILAEDLFMTPEEIQKYLMSKMKKKRKKKKKKKSPVVEMTSEEFIKSLLGQVADQATQIVEERPPPISARVEQMVTTILGRLANIAGIDPPSRDCTGLLARLMIIVAEKLACWIEGVAYEAESLPDEKPAPCGNQTMELFTMLLGAAACNTCGNGRRGSGGTKKKQKCKTKKKKKKRGSMEMCDSSKQEASQKVLPPKHAPGCKCACLCDRPRKKKKGKKGKKKGKGKGGKKKTGGKAGGDEDEDDDQEGNEDENGGESEDDDRAGDDGDEGDGGGGEGGGDGGEADGVDAEGGEAEEKGGVDGTDADEQGEAAGEDNAGEAATEQGGGTGGVNEPSGATSKTGSSKPASKASMGASKTSANASGGSKTSAKPAGSKSSANASGGSKTSAKPAGSKSSASAPGGSKTSAKQSSSKVSSNAASKTSTKVASSKSSANASATKTGTSASSVKTAPSSKSTPDASGSKLESGGAEEVTPEADGTTGGNAADDDAAGGAETPEGGGTSEGEEERTPADGAEDGDEAKGEEGADDLEDRISKVGSDLAKEAIDAAALNADGNVTFDTILQQLSYMIEETPDMEKTDRRVKLMKTLEAKFAKLVEADESAAGVEGIDEIVATVADKVALWMDKVIQDAESRISVLATGGPGDDTYMATPNRDGSLTVTNIGGGGLETSPSPVDSMAVREWSEWIIGVMGVAEDWAGWISKTVAAAEEKAKLKRGEARSSTGSIKKLTRAEWDQWKEDVKKGVIDFRMKKKHIAESAYEWDKRAKGRAVISRNKQAVESMNEIQEEEEQKVTQMDEPSVAGETPPE